MWLPYILVATFIYGVLNFVNKVAAEKKYNARMIVTVSSGMVGLVSLIILVWRGALPSVLGPIIILALANGFFFGTGHIVKLLALQRAPAAVVLPINKLNAVFVIIIGLVFFAEQPTPQQQVGMGLAVLALAILAWPPRHKTQGMTVTSAGVLLTLAAAVCTALSMTAGKLAADRVDKLTYICFSYLLVFAYCFSLLKSTTSFSGIGKLVHDRKLMMTGVLLGLLNGLGYFLVLQAFARGPLSLTQPVFSLSIIIPILLARIFYRELIPLQRVFGMVIALAAVILIKTG